MTNNKQIIYGFGHAHCIEIFQSFVSGTESVISWSLFEFAFGFFFSVEEVSVTLVSILPGEVIRLQ